MHAAARIKQEACREEDKRAETRGGARLKCRWTKCARQDGTKVERPGAPDARDEMQRCLRRSQRMERKEWTHFVWVQTQCVRRKRVFC